MNSELIQDALGIDKNEMERERAHRITTLAATHEGRARKLSKDKSGTDKEVEARALEIKRLTEQSVKLRAEAREITSQMVDEYNDSNVVTDQSSGQLALIGGAALTGGISGGLLGAPAGGAGAIPGFIVGLIGGALSTLMATSVSNLGTKMEDGGDLTGAHRMTHPELYQPPANVKKQFGSRGVLEDGLMYLHQGEQIYPDDFWGRGGAPMSMESTTQSGQETKVNVVINVDDRKLRDLFTTTVEKVIVGEVV